MQMAAPTPADTAGLAAQLERRIARLSRLLRASVHQGRSVAALLTLRRLQEEGPMRVGDLAAAESVAQPTMTGLVGRLEHDGLVRREHDEHDARVVLVALTDAGRELLDAVRGTRAAALQERLDLLGADALAAIAAALPALDDLISTRSHS